MKSALTASTIKDDDADDDVPLGVRLAIYALGKDCVSEEELDELLEAALSRIAEWNEKDRQNNA